MSEIKCPNCGKVFKIDEESYSLILQQVRNSEFNKEIDEQLENKLKLALNESENGFRDKLYLKENDSNVLRFPVTPSEVICETSANISTVCKLVHS